MTFDLINGFIRKKVEESKYMEQFGVKITIKKLARRNKKYSKSNSETRQLLDCG